MSSQLINELIVIVYHYNYDYDYELKRGSNNDLGDHCCIFLNTWTISIDMGEKYIEPKEQVFNGKA